MEAALAERLVATGCGQTDPEAAANFLLRAHVLEPSALTRGLLLQTLALLNRHVEARRLARELAASPEGRGRWFANVADYLLRHGECAAVLDFFGRGGDDDDARSLSAFVHDVFAVFADLVRDLARRLDGPRLALSIPVWGEAHTRLMLDVLFPVLLADGNLPALAARHEPCVLVFTTARDAAVMRAHEAFARVDALAPIHVLAVPEDLLDFARAFQTNPPPSGQNPRYLLQNLGSYAALEWARRVGADVVNLWPDHVYDDAYLSTLVAALATDPSAVTCPAFRLADAEVRPLLVPRAGVLALPLGDCVDLVRRWLPPENYVGGASFSRWPLQLVWPVGDEGLLVRANHYLPSVVRGSRLARPLHPSTDPIDGFFLHRFLRAPEKIRGVARAAGTAAVCAVDLGPNPLVAPPGGPFDAAEVGRWLRQFLTPIHRAHFRTSVRYARTAPTAAWDRVEAEATRTVDAVLAQAGHDAGAG